MVERHAAPAAVAVVLQVGAESPWLALSLASLLRAGAGLDWELVAVLDAPAAGVIRPMLEAFASHLPPERLTVLEGPVAGAAVGRNRGWAACRAPVVAFLSAGERCRPRRLGLPLQAFAQHDAVALLASGWEVGGITHEPWRGSGDLSPHALLRQRGLLAGCLSVRRSWLERIGGFSEDLPACSALDLLLRLQEAGGPVAWLAEPLLRCRRADQLSSSALAMAQAWGVLHRRHGEGIRPPQLLESRFAALAWCAGLAWQQGDGEGAAALLTQAAALAPLPVPRARMQALEAFCASARWCGAAGEPQELLQSALWRHGLELWP